MSEQGKSVVVGVALLAAACGGPTDDAETWSAEPMIGPAWSTQPLARSPKNPVIRPDMPGLTGELAANINGPSVIRVPEWVPNPRGRYYMYFAHHWGAFIRLAVADAPEGPWRIQEGGVLHRRDTPVRHHIASPDVIVDEAERRIRLYFHGVRRGARGQATFVATSADGLDFDVGPTELGPPYFRVFLHAGTYYAVAMQGEESGVVLRSDDGLSPFEAGPTVIPRMRHAAVHRAGETLVLFYSRIGDAPESILRSEMALTGPWDEWTVTPPVEVLRPIEDYEGARLPVRPSQPGPADEPRHELRDPALLVEAHGQYLYYAVAAEQGIGVARFAPIQTIDR